MTVPCSLCGSAVGNQDLALVPPIRHEDGSETRIHGCCPKKRFGDGGR